MKYCFANLPDFGCVYEILFRVYISWHIYFKNQKQKNILIEFALKIYKELTESNITFVKKFYIYILLFFGLFITDNIIGFSYYENISSKLEKTKEINLILKDSSVLSKDEFAKLKLLRSEIINRRTLKDNVYSFFSNISFTSSKNPITTKPIETKPIIKRNDIIHFVTSSLPICLLIIVYFLVGIIDQTETIYYKIFRISSMVLYLIPIAFLFSKIFYLIPIIDEKPLINYIINTVLSILIPYLIILASMYLTSNKRK